MIPALIGGALALGGAILSSKSQKKAANKAADVSLQTATMNNALARDIFTQNKETLAPYVGAGMQPNALIAGGLGYGDDGAYRDAFRGFIDNSDYGFQLNEGADRVDSGYSGVGAFRSGSRLKALQRFREDLQKGYRGEFNALLGDQQRLGLGAASAQAGVGQNYVGTVSANNNNAGTAAANAALLKGQLNPWANALSMGGGLLLGGFG